MISSIIYALTIACALAAAVIGMDFSPSYTAMFAVAYLCLTALGELCRNFKGRLCAFMGYLFPIAGTIFVLPSTFIYAAGDDWLWPCVRIALILPAILLLAIYLLLYRKRGRKLGFAAGLETWLALAAGVFTLACAAPSPALWLYGLGVMLILAARRFAEVMENLKLPRAMMAAGMFLCAAFLVAPMVC